MIIARQPDEITSWFLVFWPMRPDLCRWSKLVPGRFKHVSAFGFSAACATWVWYDVGLGGTTIKVLPDTSAARTLLGHWTDGCTVLHLGRCRGAGIAGRAANFCVQAMRVLVGVPGGALLPTGFWKDCLRHGAKVVIDESPESTARPDPDAGAGILGGGERPADSVQP